MGKLSDEIKNCLDNGSCEKCMYSGQINILTCRNLLQATYGQIKFEDERLTSSVYDHKTGEFLGGYAKNNIFDIVNKLTAYEELEKQGKLLKLPCAVGDTVYEINLMRNTISEFIVKGFDIWEHGIFVKWYLINGIYNNLSGFNDSEIGKTVFLTQEEAEAALKKEAD